MPDSEPILDEKALARTYDGGAYADPWETVEEYHDVMRYASKHPNKGSQAVSTATETPRSRIRTWIDDGGAPDVVRGLETARDYGWLEATYGDAEFQGLNRLVANVFSGGSIAEQYYQPSFALADGDDDPAVFDALELAGVVYTVVGDRDGRADEARPTEDGSVLGRVLSALGAPVGPKAEQRLSLPDYLADAPDEIREQFVRAYLANRAQPNNNILQLREQRNRDYLESLARLMEDVAGGPVTISEKNVILSKAATETLGSVR